VSHAIIYGLAGVGLFTLGLYALVVHAHLLRKILALNVMGNGVFLVLVSLASRGPGTPPDPVPHAMVITGIVVAVSATAFALALLLRLWTETGRDSLPDEAAE
jgi:multicomponent Na+:H+ antiporter subunit C